MSVSRATSSRTAVAALGVGVAAAILAPMVASPAPAAAAKPPKLDGSTVTVCNQTNKTVNLRQQDDESHRVRGGNAAGQFTQKKVSIKAGTCHTASSSDIPEHVVPGRDLSLMVVRDDGYATTTTGPVQEINVNSSILGGSVNVHELKWYKAKKAVPFFRPTATPAEWRSTDTVRYLWANKDQIAAKRFVSSNDGSDITVQQVTSTDGRYSYEVTLNALPTLTPDGNVQR